MLKNLKLELSDEMRKFQSFEAVITKEYRFPDFMNSWLSYKLVEEYTEMREAPDIYHLCIELIQCFDVVMLSVEEKYPTDKIFCQAAATIMQLTLIIRELLTRR